MKCIEYEIRLRTLGGGLYSALPALKTTGLRGIALTEILVECCSGPCTSRHLAIRRAEERTAVYLANRFASPHSLPLPAVQWTRSRSLRDSRVRPAVAASPAIPIFSSLKDAAAENRLSSYAG